MKSIIAIFYLGVSIIINGIIMLSVKFYTGMKGETVDAIIVMLAGACLIIIGCYIWTEVEEAERLFKKEKKE